jgi:hypothetical protein
LHDDQARRRPRYRNRNRHGSVICRRDELVRHCHWRLTGGSDGILGWLAGTHAYYCWNSLGVNACDSGVD